MIKIFFFGTPQIAVPCLEKLAQMPEIEITGVGVFPDRKVGRKQILTPCPVKESAQKLNLSISEIDSKEDLKQIFQTQKFDLGLVIAFGMIFPEEILNIPKLGVVNIHFSLLPKYRGASPVQSAILNGDKTSGITFQRMVKKLDSGDVLYPKKFDIADKKTSEVFTDFSKKAAEMLPEVLEAYESSNITPVPQNESEATICRKFEKSDGEVFPKKETAQQIYQKYLAFDLFPGVFVKTKKGNVKLTEMSISPSQSATALNCAQNTTLYIHRAQVPGKSEMPISEILKGTPDLFDIL